MGGGYVIGIIWGVIASALVLAAVSLSTPLPQPAEREAPPPVRAEGPAVDAEREAEAAPQPVGDSEPAGSEEGGEAAEAAEAVAPDMPDPPAEDAGDRPSGGPIDSIPLPAGSEFNRPPPEEDAALPSPDAALAPQAPVSPAPGAQSAPPAFDTATAPQPEIAVAPDAPQGTAAPADAAVATPDTGSEPSAPAPVVQPAPLTAPETADAPVATDDPAPVASDSAEGEMSDTPQPSEMASEGGMGEGAEPAADAADAAETAEPDAPVEALSAAPDDLAATPDPGSSDAEPAVDIAEAPDDAPASAAPAEAMDAAPEADPDADMAQDADAAPETEAADLPFARPEGVSDEVAAVAGLPGSPAAPLASAASPRLPQVTAEAPDAADDSAVEEASEMPEATEEAQPEAEAAPNALVDHAAPFPAEETRALIAVVLIDDPDTRLDLNTLTRFAFPVAFAIDPARPDAADRAAAFRAAGFEVLIQGSAIAPGATAADTETALAAARATIPEAVALLDTPESRIQSDRPVLDATVAALAETGHGMLAFPRGLNAAEQTAARADVPAATLFRLLDDEDQRATVITRYLSRAEFAAVQEGSVIVAGRTRPDTVTALFSWALGDRNEGVAIAPVSAVLLRGAEGS